MTYNWGVVVHLAEQLLERRILVCRELRLWENWSDDGVWLGLSAIWGRSYLLGIFWGWVRRHYR